MCLPAYRASLFLITLWHGFAVAERRETDKRKSLKSSTVSRIRLSEQGVQNEKTATLSIIGGVQL